MSCWSMFIIWTTVQTENSEEEGACYQYELVRIKIHVGQKNIFSYPFNLFSQRTSKNLAFHNAVGPWCFPQALKLNLPYRVFLLSSSLLSRHIQRHCESQKANTDRVLTTRLAVAASFLNCPKYCNQTEPFFHSVKTKYVSNTFKWTMRVKARNQFKTLSWTAHYSKFAVTTKSVLTYKEVEINLLPLLLFWKVCLLKRYCQVKK